MILPAPQTSGPKGTFTMSNKRNRKTATDEKPARRTRRASEKPAVEPATPTPGPKESKPSPAAEITGVKPFSKEPVADRIRPVKAGTKMAAILDLLSRKQGATLDELQALLSPKSPIRTVLNWDMNQLIGYGYKVGEDGVVHLVLPKGMKVPPHIVK
jgi:hypothetical protein